MVYRRARRSCLPLHAGRTADHAGSPPDAEESAFLASLLLMTLIGEPLFGTTARRSAGLAADRATNRRFRHWLLERMQELAGADAAAPGAGNQRR